MSGLPMPDIRADFFASAGAGLPLGYSAINKFGYNPDVDSVAEEDIWTVGGVYVFPSDSGETLEIVSSTTDTNDVVIIGLDENFIEKTEVITLTGVTAVTLSGLWSRVFRAFNPSSTGYVGTITIRADGAGTTFAEILPADQQTNMTIFTVPAGKTAFVKLFSVAMNKTGGATGVAIFRFKLRPFGTVFRTQLRFGTQSAGSSFASEENVVPQPIPEKTDIKLSCIVTSDNTDVSAFYTLLIIDNSQLNKYRGEQS